MFITSYKSEILLNKKLIVIPKEKSFLDDEFCRILDFLSQKGLRIIPNAILDGWDASFMKRHLDNENLGKTAYELHIFLLMRDSDRIPIEVNWKPLLGSHFQSIQ